MPLEVMDDQGSATRVMHTETFAEVTSQVPSGACVIATWNADHEPVGALLTGFTPISHARPTLILAVSKDALGIDDVREQGRCSVAVLSEDQDALLRQLSDPAVDLHALEWRVTPAGLPVLDGVAGWLECRVLRVEETADTVVVAAEAVDSGLAENMRPMLRYQGGFGQFVPARLSSLQAVGPVAARRVVEYARQPIEVLARDLGVECSVIAYEDGDAVAVAVSNHSSLARQTRLGSRIPVVPPLGIHFAANPGSGIGEEEWLAKLGDTDGPTVELVRAQLARVRERGWSITLSGPLSVQELDELVGAYSDSSDPAHTAALLAAIRSMAASHDPEEILPDGVYDVMAMTVPVRSRQGATVAVLRLLGFPSQVTGAEVLLWLSMLRDAARSVEELLEPRPITSKQTRT